MSDKILTLTDIHRVVKPLAEKYHIGEVYLFGSYARNQASPSKEFKTKHSDIPRNMISSLRHRLVHDYEGTNWSIISDVVFEEIPKLTEQLQLLLS